MCSPAPSSSPLLMKRRASLPSSPNNYFLYPILQEGVTMLSTLSTSMSNLPTSILNILGLSQTDSTTSTQNMTSMMRELVMDQQRTMFYTVTMCPTQKEAPETKRILTPSLKWQCASSLSKSHTVLHRTNQNSSKYYTFTYMGEEDTFTELVRTRGYQISSTSER